MNKIISKLCDQEKDQQAVTDMLYALKDDLCFPNREAARKIVGLCFEKGGVIGVYDGSLLCGMAGFFYGEPDQNFWNREIAFLYVAGILPRYRLSRVFRNGLIFAVQTFKEMAFREIRLQARASDPYTNGLYARFAKRLGESKSLRGDTVITYGGTIDDALDYLERRNRRNYLSKHADELLTTVH